MKFVKFGIFALSMGLFVASCGNSTEETTATDTTTVVAPVETAPVTVDTAMAAPADTTMAAPADTTAAAH